MDDLSGIDWSSSATSQSSKLPAVSSSANYYQSFGSTPSPFTSGRNTPLSIQGSGNVAPKPQGAKTAKPTTTQDSFSNLVNFGVPKPASANLSLREQQQKLETERRRKEEEKQRQAAAHFGNGQHLDALGARTTQTPPTLAAFGAAPAGLASGQSNDDDDLFAAFNADTKVDNSSFYPPPPQKSASAAQAPPSSTLDLSNPSAWNASKSLSSAPTSFAADEDDPFGLNNLKAKQSAAPTSIDEDDDLLGDLGRPVDEVRRKQQMARPEPGKPIEDYDSDSDSVSERPPRKANAPPKRPSPGGGSDPFDQAVAQLVDFGFSADDARRGLTESGAGVNVQAAASWLLDDAHRKAKEKATGKAPSTTQNRGRDGGRQGAGAGAAWMRDEERNNSQPRRDDRSPASGADGDLAQTAAAMSSKAFKAAGSLWKMGQKKMQQAVADFQQPETDANVPKWMRTAQQDRQSSVERRAPDVTDEAMMLESGARPGQRPSRGTGESRQGLPRTASRDQSPALSATSSGRGTPVPKWQQSASASSLDSRSRLGRLAAEDSAPAYVSPNRRKKTPQPVNQTSPPPEPEGDLLFGESAARAGPSLPIRQQRTTTPQQPSSQAKKPSITPRATPSPAPRPAAPPRQVPTVSALALQSSTRHRLDGTAHFKRGDYAAAHASYSSSLQGIPATHPLVVVLLTNRALTSLKTGVPAQAVEDADAALRVIGPSAGQGETILVMTEGGGEDRRDMRELYGKALSRKAEALEQMERWADAGAVWQACVEAGVGGATAVAGRQRCQKALAPKPKAIPRPAAAAKPRPKPKPSAALALAGDGGGNSEAVERLREANRAAAREDDEKFALADRIDTRIAAWRDGKRENLRALLGSLDQVLWEGSGWKKVGLHELVVANRVKVVYMKAIAKTHPDKLPQDASTEVRLIAGTVFSTLNEAWDKFKAENGL